MNKKDLNEREICYLRGVTTLLATIGALAGVFIYGRKFQAKELQRKMQSVDNPQIGLDLAEDD